MTLWIEKLIPKNKYSRPGTKLQSVKKIINHYTANPGASAYNHYKYFSNLRDRYASAHIFVDKQEAYLIIPLNEVAYAANDGSYRGVSELRPNANYKSISVELCIEKDGSFHPETFRRAAQINAELCKMYKLDPVKDIVRHYDVTHKNCPALWVKNPDKFKEFKDQVSTIMNGVKVTTKKEEVRMLKPTTNTLKDEVSIFLMRLSEVKVHGENAISPEWRNKFNRGELPLDDMIGLICTVVNRGQLDIRDGRDE